jgi:hypothetical protein
MTKADKISKLFRTVQSHLALKAGVWRASFDLPLPTGVFDAFTRDLDALQKMGLTDAPPKLEVLETLAKSFVRAYEDDCTKLVRAMTGKPDASFRLADLEKRAIVNFLIWLVRVDAMSETARDRQLREVIPNE